MFKTISIHQPETFPYAGYFSKMMHSDEFIILDNVQFKKNNYQNRNQIIHAGKPKWLTFPVLMEGRLHSTIADIEFSESVDWRSRNIKILEDAYRECEYYRYHMPILRDIINKADHSLMSFNMDIIEYMRNCLHINTPLIYSSKLNINSHKSDLVFDICESRGATSYLSGQGGRDYLDLFKFTMADIDVSYQVFVASITYTQQTNEFIPYMSVIDLLMNNDNKTARDYIGDAFKYTI